MISRSITNRAVALKVPNEVTPDIQTCLDLRVYHLTTRSWKCGAIFCSLNLIIVFHLVDEDLVLFVEILEWTLARSRIRGYFSLATIVALVAVTLLLRTKNKKREKTFFCLCVSRMSGITITRPTWSLLREKKTRGKWKNRPRKRNETRRARLESRSLLRSLYEDFTKCYYESRPYDA